MTVNCINLSPDGIPIIRKSMIESYNFCPRQFYLEWVRGVEKRPNQAMLVGTRFHEFADRFFDFCDGIPIGNWEEMIPVEFSALEYDMAEWFINNERQRYIELATQGREDEFQPILREHTMLNDTVWLTSTVDRVDWVDKSLGTVRVVEYKTGSKVNTTSLVRQLAFYAVLWQSTTGLGNITELRLINPKIPTVVDFNVTPDMATNVLLDVITIRKAIEQNNFPPSCTEGKFAACKQCTVDEVGMWTDEDTVRRFASYIVSDDERFSDVYG